ncbi:MAG: hypothetical protein JWQ43_4051 [Glaciihabitans sp.]|nr:hypothetical protein [Glaciihabitans sp.]
MSERNTVIRSLHDVGLAAWFGGTLMGAVGLNGAAAEAKDPRERLSLSSEGWKKWAPIQAVAIAAHAVGGIGLIVANRDRLAAQPEARVNSYIKLPITLIAAGASFYSGILGTRIAEHADEGGAGTTEPHAAASRELASAQSQQKILQWVLPALTGILIVMGSQQGEQQRPIAGLLRK